MLGAAGPRTWWRARCPARCWISQPGADYSASSGHLINHAAAPGVEYRDCRHPRFGHVLCVLTLRDIARGEELFVKVTSHNIT